MDDMNLFNLDSSDESIEKMLNGLDTADTTRLLHALNALSIEYMLSDRIHAIFSSKSFYLTRYLYDIFVITGERDIDYKALKFNLDNAGKIDFNKTSIEDILKKYKNVWEVMIIVIEGEELPKPEFDDVIERLTAFCIVLYEDMHNYTRWDHKKKRWLYEDAML